MIQWLMINWLLIGTFTTASVIAVTYTVVSAMAVTCGLLLLVSYLAIKD